MSNQLHIYSSTSWNVAADCETTSFEFPGGHAEYDGETLIATIDGVEYEVPTSFPVAFIQGKLGFDNE